MNFDFSDDQKMLRDQARKFLSEKCTTKTVRKVFSAVGVVFKGSGFYRNDAREGKRPGYRKIELFHDHRNTEP